MSNTKRIFLLLGGSPVNGVAVVAGSYVELQKKVDAVFMTTQSVKKVSIRHPILSEDSAVRKAGVELLVSLPQRKERLSGLISTLETDDSSTMRGPMGLQQVLDTHTSQAPVSLICFADGYVSTQQPTRTDSKPAEDRQQTPPPQRQRVPTSPHRFDNPPTHRRVPSVASPSKHQPSFESVERQAFKRVASRMRSPSKPAVSETRVSAELSPAHYSPIRSLTDVVDRVRSPSKTAPQRRPEVAAVVVPPPAPDIEDPEELALRKRYKDLLEGMDRRKQEAQRIERQYPPIHTTPKSASGRSGAVSANTFDSLGAMRLHLINTTDASVSQRYPELRIASSNYGPIESDEDFQRVQASREDVDFTWCETGSRVVIEDNPSLHDDADETATLKLVNTISNSTSHIRLVISPLPTLEDLRRLVQRHVPGFGKYDNTSAPDLFFCTPARRNATHENAQKRPVRTDHDVAALCQLCFMPGTFLRAECY